MLPADGGYKSDRRKTGGLAKSEKGERGKKIGDFSNENRAGVTALRGAPKIGHGSRQSTIFYNSKYTPWFVLCIFTLFQLKRVIYTSFHTLTRHFIQYLVI